MFQKDHFSYSKHHIQVANLEQCFSQTQYHGKITLHCSGPRTNFNGTATLPLNPQIIHKSMGHKQIVRKHTNEMIR